MAAGCFLSGVMAFAEGFPSMKADIFMRKRFCLSFHGKSPIFNSRRIEQSKTLLLASFHPGKGCCYMA